MHFFLTNIKFLTSLSVQEIFVTFWWQFSERHNVRKGHCFCGFQPTNMVNIKFLIHIIVIMFYNVFVIASVFTVWNLTSVTTTDFRVYELSRSLMRCGIESILCAKPLQQKVLRITLIQFCKIWLLPFVLKTLF